MVLSTIFEMLGIENAICSAEYDHAQTCHHDAQDGGVSVAKHYIAEDHGLNSQIGITPFVEHFGMCYVTFSRY